MYYVAKVDAYKCSEYKCNMCTLYCPEANTLMFDTKNGKGSAWVDADRCKGCEVCVYVCRDMLNRECISMEMISTE